MVSGKSVLLRDKLIGRTLSYQDIQVIERIMSLRWYEWYIRL